MSRFAHHVSDTVNPFTKANEGEYVTAAEYCELTAGPSGFFLRKYLPRVFAALEPLQKLPALPPSRRCR